MKKVKFLKIYKTNKLALFCNTKNPFELGTKANVIYRITCPGCFSKHIGKTDHNHTTRLDEHGTKPDQPMYQHLNSCAKFNDCIKFL